MLTPKRIPKPELTSVFPRVLTGALAFCLLVSSAHAQSDADFLAAKAAFDKGDRARMAALGPKLSGHVLAPYVEFCN